jgi:hypothetical protein
MADTVQRQQINALAQEESKDVAADKRETIEEQVSE